MQSNFDEMLDSPFDWMVPENIKEAARQFKMEKKYALIEWEDEYVSIIDVVTIVHPRKEVSHYREGEVVKAKFKGAVYEAIICEISGKFKAPRASVLKSNS